MNATVMWGVRDPRTGAVMHCYGGETEARTDADRLGGQAVRWVEIRTDVEVVYDATPVNGRRQRIPDDVRQRIYARDGHACITCGETTDLTLDHIHPWSLGGDDTEDNLQTMCRRCNASKGARV